MGDPDTALLIVKGLRKRYGQGDFVLKGIDLTFQQNEFVVVIGSSGAGKSTLMRCLNRMIEPSEGEIIFGGLHIEKIKGKQLRRQRSDMGMIFQHYNLIGRVSVIKNVLYGRLGKMPFWKSLLGLYSEKEIQAAYALLQKVGLAEYLYERADTLSGGQMQRVGICRALVQEPKLLLADEPVASLDPTAAEIVLSLMKTLTAERNLTCIVNLHQVNYAAKYATRIIGIRDGLVLFDGTPEKLTEEIISSIYENHQEKKAATFYG